jgi:hypothetical protein
MWNRRMFGLSLAIAFALIGLAQSQEPGREGKPAKAPEPVKATLGEPQVVEVQVRLPDQAPPKEPEVARPVLVLGPPEESRVTPRLSVREDVGDGVGYTRGYTYIEGFLPIYQAPGEFVIFLDARGVNFDEAHRWEWNAGAGARWAAPCSNWVYGVNTFFDWRDTGSSVFRQIGAGFEAMGPDVDFRSNFYLPIGGHRHGLDFGNPQFAGTNILLDHFFENAMRGFDTEVGAPIPLLDRLGLRGYAGFYHYDNSNAPTINGIRGRLEARLTDNLTAHFAVQNDHVFNTTVSGGLALQWGGRRPLGSGRSVTDRLGERVVRDTNIVVTRNADKEAAIDPNTGKPIEVRHADSNAPGGGDGSVERPFQTLAQLQAGSAAGQILFVHTNSVFAGQSITLQNAQRFLGDGTLHAFTATQGSFFLPLGVGAAPVIQNVVANSMVKLANDNEVSGFNFGAAAPGFQNIFGISIVNFNINNNTFINPAINHSSLALIDTTGSGVIANNTFGQNQAAALTAGYIVRNFSAGTLRLTITDNTTYGHSFAGGFIDISGAAKVFATLRNNNFSDTAATNQGLFARVNTNATLGLQLLNNISNQGYKLQQFGTGTFQVEDSLGTNTGMFSKTGTITTVPVGTFGFPPP